MASSDTIAKIKQALRISHSVLDDDIAADVDACLADLSVCGVVLPQESDPLIYKAIKLYCLAGYTDDTDKAAAYLDRYEKLKACLMMAEGYGYEEAVADG